MMNEQDFRTVIAKQRQKAVAKPWKGTVLEYLTLVHKTPEIAVFAPGRIYNMIMSYGIEDVPERFKTSGYEDLVKYKFFDNKIYGTLEPIHDIMRFLKAAARRTETGKRILIMVGPVASGKSTIASLVKRGLEIDDKPIYTIDGCPLNEEPLHAIPFEEREFWEKKLGVKIEGVLCPVCQQKLDSSDFISEGGHAKWEELPVKKIKLSEQRRMGIGTFQPSDPKSQDVSELIGSVNMSKIARFGESDPRAYDFKGELEIANRGMIEYIEILKADVKFHYILLTAAQEQMIKAPKFPQIYVDEIILSHSITGDMPVPYKKDGIIKFDTIKNLTYNNDMGIEVIAVNMKTKKPEWTKVESFYKHPFTGNLIKTIQKEGYVETTYNHSIYSEDYECFYPEEKKNILTINNIPYSENIEQFTLNTSDNMFIDKGNVRMKLIEGNQGNGMLKKNIIKHSYHCKQANGSHVKNILKIIAWYITEGHVSDKTKSDRSCDITISQNNIDILENLMVSASKLTTTKLYLQDRSEKEDQTSRLRFPSTIWKEIMELNCGRYSKNKKIPDFVFNLPIEFKKYFIDELVKGDGPVNERKMKSGDNHFSYKTISKMLASQLCFLLSQLNIKYSIGTGKTKNGDDAFDIKTINNHSTKRKNKIENYHVENVEVYDIECVDNHSFVAGIGNVLCHNTNQTEFDTFKADKKNEALHDRMYPISVPWNLRVSDEIKIYEKIIRESDFRNVHIAPQTLKVAAQFAVLSRLVPSQSVKNPIEKMKIYDGEVTEEFRKTDIDVKKLLVEGRAAGEGMTGVSPRFIMNALNIALGSKEDKNCINPVDIIRALINNFSHSIGMTEEEIQRCMNLLKGDKNSIVSEYKEIAKKEVNVAFLHAYDDQATSLFDRYMTNVTAFCTKEKVVDSVTDEQSDPDEDLMRSLEELIGVPVQSKAEFRNGIFVQMAKCLKEKKPFTFKDYKPLKEAIEKKLMHDLKNVVNLSIGKTTSTSQKGEKRRDTAMKRLMKNGYCKHCASFLLSFVGEILRKTG